MDYELYLAHHGIFGQKWGVRRYQNKDGTLTNAGKDRYGSNGSSPRHKPSNARKQAKQRAANLEKARKAKAAKAEFETKKKNALETGNATEVLKFKGHLSNKELQDAFNRINLERQLSDISAKENAKGKSKVDKALEWLSKHQTRIETAAKIFGKIPKIMKDLDEKDKKQAAANLKLAKSKELKKALTSGLIPLPLYDKLIANEYVDINDVKEYIARLEKEKAQK